MAFSKKSFVFGVISFAALGLVACGDDSGNGFAPTNGNQVGSIYELGQCSAEREGVSVLVTDENTYYLCTSSEWKPVAEYNGPVSSSTLTPSSSSTPTEDLGSSSSVKDPEQVDGSSSSVIASEAKQSSSSVVSSSSVTSSSSVESSSSSAPTEDPSSSSSSVIASSSGTKQSSSSVAGKPAWQYLNPSIDYGTMTDTRDGQVYKTVTIGTQIWMAENLNYAYTGVKYNYNGYTSDSTSWCYDNKASNCDKYGRLYTWSAVMDSAAQFSVNAGTQCGYGKTCTPNSPHRGICPEGWHVPTNEEYSSLYAYIGGSSTAGSLLKSTSGWSYYNDKSGNGTDKYGFSVLPAGLWYHHASFEYAVYYADLWSASESNYSDAWYQNFFCDNDDAYQLYSRKYDGGSLRCLKD